MNPAPRHPGAQRPTDEFPAGASGWPGDLDRREFLQVMGASLLLAGMAGCGRPPPDTIAAAVVPPESRPTGDSRWYATASAWEGFARGVLARSAGGRPVKLEGNPDHPESRGAADARTQASLLDLYDPDRSDSPRHEGRPAGWDDFATEWTARLAAIRSRRGAGVVLLTEPTTSPTLLREIHALLADWPQAEWYQHTALTAYALDGGQDDFDFAAAGTVLSLDADFLTAHPASVRYARDFFTRRRSPAANRLFAIEPAPSLTGSMADERVALAPHRLPGVLNRLAARLAGRDSADGADAGERRFVDALAAALQGARAPAICLAGTHLPDEWRRWANAFNVRFAGSAWRRIAPVRSDDDSQCRGGLTAFLQRLAAGASEVVILGCNPAYTAPGSPDVSRDLAALRFTVHAGEQHDETGVACRWHLPGAHYLETWSDVRGFGGEASIIQPLIEPMRSGKSPAEVLRFLRTGEFVSAYDLVRETWQAQIREAGAPEANWHEWLKRGIIPGTAAASAPTSGRSGFPQLPVPVPPSGMTALIRADDRVSDGRSANNGWLQELPQAATALVWDNAIALAPDDARRLGVANGDVLSCAADGARIEGPAWIVPGQAAGCLVVPLGFGRTVAGEVGKGRGFSAYALRTENALWQRDGVVVTRAGRHLELVALHAHLSMEGRDLARVVDAADSTPRAEPPASAPLFPAWPRQGYAWGMSIDLDSCFGCQACVIACQAENNTPVVGREQAARGREMHWIRIDRYVAGSGAAGRFVHQPVMCVQCENAPCELVCPVGATVHSSEGLNDMVYNRCVGTRYCSNNCPYKVRRFNFLDYRPAAGSPLLLQANPDVTVRERGVMEKCSYCVQRINAARIAAERENRAIRDGEIRTACEQACPSAAIVFGDRNDPASRVTRLGRAEESYALLGELGTRPRTRYRPRRLRAAVSPAAEREKDA